MTAKENFKGSGSKTYLETECERSGGEVGRKCRPQGTRRKAGWRLEQGGVTLTTGGLWVTDLAEIEIGNIGSIKTISNKIMKTTIFMWSS